MKMTKFLLVLFLLNILKVQAQEESISKIYDRYKTYESLKEALKNPDEVYVLDLHYQKLKAFPPEIFQFKNLKILDLRDNEITAIPENIGELKKLQSLSLFTNQIKIVTPNIKDLKNLQELFLGNNPLENLSPEIAKLPNLTRLGLINTKIDKENQRKIKRLVPKDCKVRFKY